MDLSSRRADARHGLAAPHRFGRRVTAHRPLVPLGGMCVTSTGQDGATARMAEPLAAFRRAVVSRFTAVDITTLLYVGIATAALLAFWGGDHAGWHWLLAAHALLV